MCPSNPDRTGHVLPEDIQDFVLILQIEDDLNLACLLWVKYSFIYISNPLIYLIHAGWLAHILPPIIFVPVMTEMKTSLASF